MGVGDSVGRSLEHAGLAASLIDSDDCDATPPQQPVRCHSKLCTDCCLAGWVVRSAAWPSDVTHSLVLPMRHTEQSGLALGLRALIGSDVGDDVGNSGPLLAPCWMVAGGVRLLAAALSCTPLASPVTCLL